LKSSPDDFKFLPQLGHLFLHATDRIGTSKLKGLEDTRSSASQCGHLSVAKYINKNIKYRKGSTKKIPLQTSNNQTAAIVTTNQTTSGKIICFLIPIIHPSFSLVWSALFNSQSGS